jgi:hypothetical protein
MKKKVSLKLFATVIWRGLCQAFRAIIGVFDPRKKSPFWRIIWSLITICLIFITVIFCMAWHRQQTRYETEWMDETELSTNVSYFKYRYGSNKPGFICDSRDNSIIIDKVSWVAGTGTTDSLLVYAQGNKRGYINRYNGKQALPCVYDAAWVFSSGIAAVAENDSVYFINHSGKQVFPQKFRRTPNSKGYCFHGSYCAIPTVDGKYGFIDKSGQWVMQPQFTNVENAEHNTWLVCLNDSTYGVIDSSMNYLLECKYPNIRTSADGIIVTNEDHTEVLYDYDGVAQDKFICNKIGPLYYTSAERDSNNEFISKPAKCMYYEMSSGYEGLADANGKPITPPLYWEILPIGEDLYQCTLYSLSASVVLNGKGEVVKQ